MPDIKVYWFVVLQVTGCKHALAPWGVSEKLSVDAVGG